MKLSKHDVIVSQSNVKMIMLMLKFHIISDAGPRFFFYASNF